ncbi:MULTISPECIES: oligoendopeptidase F [unclassified Mesobacillus]|uniref:oligoendopeptidase F n=1 Tax=unclassified Mesobacillus TaxID=2675270 RepID=UPI00203FE277|nr:MULTISPECIES: oligoendopeptidase F [unclassified Mesobacillus]MCM3125280.1 oligoendopeptidase F [Mesobacillus sp. MER 33]MCM3235289.1 oligoendopeptidase F [Mesobacillus sp. MER 48]
MAKQNERMKRQDVDQEQTWDLTALFETREDWERELKAVKEDLPKVTQYKGKLGNSAAELLECLEAREKLLERLNLVSMYADLRQSVDHSDSERQKDAALASDAQSIVNAELAFAETEIIKLPNGKLESFLNEEPGLEPFKKYLSDLQDRKPHALGEETEGTLAALGSLFSSPYNIYNRGKLSDMQFDPFIDDEENEIPLSFALYAGKYASSPSSMVRRNSYESFNKTLNRYKHTFAATYATQVNQEVTMARLRNYESATAMLLHDQQVTQEMYDNQLDVIQKELAPHMRRYANLKKRVLGLDKMTNADLKAPLDPDYKIETSYEEAAETVKEALEIMGPEYSEMIKTALSERWVDYADNVGKSTGAFCSSPYGAHPYVLMTWPDTMRGAFTLAHELGHAGHFYLAGKNQRMTNTRPSRYFIEAPSTMNEMLLGNHLLKNTNDTRKRRWVILQLLGTYYHNFVTHLLEGELQRRVYNLAEKGEPLTADLLSKLKLEVLKNFWGNSVEMDEGAGLTWMHQPHYYMGLYPYTYSAGLTVSTLVSRQILEEGKPAVEKWLEVLKAGGTMKPLDLIKKAGVDMSRPEPIHEAVEYVGKHITELEESYEQ